MNSSMATYRFCWMRNESREMIMATHFRRLRVKPSTKIKVLVQSFILEMGMSRGRNSSIPFETHRKISLRSSSLLSMFDMPFLIEKMESIPRSHKRTKDSKVCQITMLCNLRRKTRDYINGKSRRNFH